MNAYAKYGLIAGAAIIIWKLFIFYSGNQFTPIGVYSNLISFLFMIPFIIMGISKRRKELNNTIDIKQAVKTGLFISLIISVMIAFFNFIFMKVAFNDILSQAEALLKQMNTSAKDMAKDIKGMKSYYDPFHQATTSLFITLITGGLISIITATFFARKSL